MRFYNRFSWLCLITISWAKASYAQLPSSSISPSGNLTVCAGSTVNVSATVNNAFPGTTDYAVSNIPFAPFPATGTAVNLADDAIAGPLPIGFVFCFYGNSYSQFFLSSNGWIGFSGGQTIAFTANTIPNTSWFVPKNCIMGPWMDFNPALGPNVGNYIRYQTQGTAPFRRLVVSWTNVPLFQCITTYATFQIVIYESTNIIEHHITNKPVCMSWAGGVSTQGLHNLTGTAAVSVPGRNATVWTATNDGKRFTPIGPPTFTTNWTANGFPIGSGPSISHTVNAPTQIIANTTFQCSNLVLRDTLNISLGGPANASFTGPATVCAGQSATFTYTGGAPPGATFNWSFPGGTPATSTSAGPVLVNYPTNGNFTASLTVSATGCSPGTNTQNITVGGGPNPSINIPASACAGSNVNISYNGTAPIGSVYSWNFGPGSTIVSGSGAGPYVVSFANAGNQAVSVTVTGGGCSATATQNINITSGPAAGITASAAAICLGANASLQLNTAPVAGATYTWNFGAGAAPATATGAGPHNVSWTSAGAKSISLSATQGGCSTTATTTITVNALPSSAFTATSPICVGSNTTLTYTGGASPATFNWTLPAGSSPATLTGPGPHNVTLANAGANSFGLLVTSNGCTSNLSSQNVTVNLLPTATINTSAASACTGNSINVGTNAQAGATYNWNFGAGASPATATGAGPHAVAWSTAGNKTITLTITQNGCTSAPITATVNVINGVTSTFTMPAAACEGQAITLTYTGTGVAANTFNWTIGGPGQSSTTFSGIGPHTVSWSSAGSKNVSLSVNNGTCTSPVTTQSIVVNPIYSSNFSLPATTCVGQNTVVSYGGNAPVGATYNWNFGGGTIVSGTGPGPYQITWPSTGLRTVTLSVSMNGCTSAVSSQNINVAAPPSAAFTAPVQACINQASTITYTGGATGATFSWNFGAGATPATASNVGPHVVSYTTVGVKTITLSITQNGCTSTQTHTLNVSPQPVAAFIAPASVCSGANATIVFAATPSPPAGSTYNWNWDGGTVISGTGAGPYQIQWPSAGIRTVSVSVTNPSGCTSAPSAQNINVVAPATATFSAASPVCVNSNSTITYTGNAPIGATYNWNFDGGTIISGSGQGPYQVQWPTAGNRNISLTVTHNGCTSAVFSQTVVVSPLPVASFTVNPTPLCQGSNATVTFTGSAPAGAAYNWNFGPDANVVSGAGAGPYQINYSASGPRTIFLTVSANGCLSNAASQMFNVIPANTAAINLPATGCASNPVTVQFAGSAPAGATYNWNFGGGTVVSGSGQGPYQVQWPAAGNYNVSLSITQGACVSNTATQSITIFNQPSANIQLNSPGCAGSPQNISATGNFSTGAQFLWNFGSGTVLSGSGAGPYQVNFAPAGSYPIALTVTENGCSSSTANATMVVNQINPVSIDAASSVAIHTPTTIQLVGTIPAGADIQWNFGTAQVLSGSGAGPYDLQWTSEGVQPISLQVSVPGCSPVSAQHSIHVIAGATVSFTANNACAGSASEITFTGLALPSAQYFWNFGSGTVISGSGPGPFQVQYPTAGPQTLWLVVEQNGIYSDTVFQTLQINPLPVASFTISGASCSGTPIHFAFNGSASGAATFTWNHNGGTGQAGPTQQEYFITYPSGGSYPVTLTVEDQGCASAPITNYLTVHTTPEPLMELDSLVCQGDAAYSVYVGSGSQNAQYYWDFDGAVVLSGNNQGPYALQWPQAGLKTVRLQVTEFGCPSDTTALQVIVKPKPTNEFEVNTPLCNGDTVHVQYTGNAPANAQFNWTFPQANVISGAGQGPYALDYPSTGAYYISLNTNWDGCIAPAQTQSVEVQAIPVSDFQVADTIYVNQVIPVAFTGQAAASAAYTWNFDGAQIISGSQQGPYQISFSQPGDYQISLQILSGVCASQLAMHSITVLPLPEVTFQMPANICHGDTVLVTYTGNAQANAQFVWNWNGATVLNGSGMGPYTILWPQPGIHQVSLSLIINGVSTPEIAQSIAVQAVPVAAFSTPSAACIGQISGLNFTGNAGANAQFSWNFDSAQLVNGSGGGPYELLWSNIGTYNLSLYIEENGCYSDTVSHTISVMAQPQAAFSLPGYVCEQAEFTVNFTGQATADASFDWQFQNLQVISGSGAGPYTLRAGAAGVATASLVVMQSCGNDTLTLSTEIRTLPQVNAGLDRQLCSGDTIQLFAEVSPGATVVWSPATGLLDPGVQNPFLHLVNNGNEIVPNTYFLAADNGSCQAIDSVVINTVPRPTAHFDRPDPQCRVGNQFSFDAQGNYLSNASFLWNFGPHANAHVPTQKSPENISFQIAGWQTVTLNINQFGCNAIPYTDSVLVHENPSPDFRVSAEKGCIPLEATFEDLSTPQGSIVSRLWNFGNGQQSTMTAPTNTYTEEGSYGVSLHVTDQNGCDASIVKNNFIKVFPNPDAQFKIYPQIAYIGQEIALTSLTTGPGSCSFDMGNGDIFYQCNGHYAYIQEGDFAITFVATNQFGCSDSSQQIIRVESGPDIYIPTAFTPNNDGLNDEFRIYGSGIQRMNLMIFNRWGELVFQTSDIEKGWNGDTVSGKTHKVDNFTYKLVYVGKDGVERVNYGRVALLD